jgi:ankyrin repeat protein
MHLDPHYQVVALIEAKADVNQATTDDGSTPLSGAAFDGHADVVSRPLSTVSTFSIASRSIQAPDLLGLTASSPYALGSPLPGGGADRGQG